MKEKNLKKTVCCNTRHFHDAHGSSKVICLNTHCDNYLGYTGIKRSGSFYAKLISGAFILISSIVLTSDYSPELYMDATEEASMVMPEISMNTPLTIENLEKEIHEQGIQFPDVVIAQMCLESGNLNSFLFRKTNNMLGMRFPLQRPTSATGLYLPGKDTVVYGSQDELRKYGKMNNYAVYETWQDAVKDYKMWQDYCFNAEKAYLKFLGNVYAEDPNYVSKLEKMTDLNS